MDYPSAKFGDFNFCVLVLSCRQTDRHNHTQNHAQTPLNAFLAWLSSAWVISDPLCGPRCRMYCTRSVRLSDDLVLACGCLWVWIWNRLWFETCMLLLPPVGSVCVWNWVSRNSMIWLPVVKVTTHGDLYAWNVLLSNSCNSRSYDIRFHIVKCDNNKQITLLYTGNGFSCQLQFSWHHFLVFTGYFCCHAAVGRIIAAGWLSRQ